MGRLARGARPTTRRIVLGLAALACLLLSVFPVQYRAASSLTPTDPSSLGLGEVLSQLGALNTVFGNQAAVEVSLKVGRSVVMRQEVARRLGLVKRVGLKDDVDAARWLEREVEMRSLRGGIVEVESIQRDPQLATDLVSTFTTVLREKLAEIAVRQTHYKRDILEKLVSDANDAFAQAQARYNDFRLKTRYSDPAYAIDAIGARIPVVQAAIKSKEVELDTARQFATDDNLEVRQIMAQIASLNAQLRQLQDLSPTQSNSIGRVVDQSTEAERLERELLLKKTLYYNYRRILEGTTVEDLTSKANIRVLEQPYIDTDRQYRLIPLVAAMLLLLLGVAIEVYQLRPPVRGGGDAE
jgi:tyrosine-protein kinase Etk/Wzc